MKKNFKKILAVLLASTMVIGMTACGGKEGKEEGGATKKNDTPLVVGTDTLSQKFSPFTADTEYDRTITNFTMVSLMTTDRLGGIIKNGIEGETVEYNGTPYTYKGTANLDWSYDEGTDVTTYTAKLREDMVFSDGEPVTADDVIFTYYVYLDTSYVGSTTLNSYPIIGLANYRANSTAAEGVEVTDEQIENLLANPTDQFKEYIQNYIANILTAEWDWAEGAVAEDPSKGSVEEFYVACYSLEEGYKGTDKETILADIIAQYGTDYKSLAARYAGDEAYFDGDIKGEAKQELFDAAVAAAGGEEVPNISGIKKIDDYTVEVKVKGFEAPAVYSILGVEIVPMHYYGDKNLYDYDNNQFGFTRGDLTAVNEKETKPMGAGPYIFKEYTNKTVYYEANPNYFLGEPKIKNIQFKEVTPEEVAADVEAGTIDCGEMTGSVTRFNEVAGYNSNGETTGDVITTSMVDNLGYGYIGINADTVMVGSKKDSDESKALRKALMTIMAVYRETTVDSYYGEAAAVINYPISNTSWAAPQATDEDYKVSYSVDVEGNAIYTAEMSADEKYAAALEAAKGYFKAAGYEFGDDGKIKSAPTGAKKAYEVIIPAAGKGDHPDYGILTDAKAALETIGFELIINDPADSNELWNSLDAGTQELWCAAWGASIDPDMYQIYHSSNVAGLGGSDSNHYHIQDKELDKLIKSARVSEDQSYRKAIYKEAMEIIMDWAVELPVYQRQNCVIFSTKRINMDTVTPDITTFYKWYTEIENMEMN